MTEFNVANMLVIDKLSVDGRAEMFRSFFVLIFLREADIIKTKIEIFEMFAKEDGAMLYVIL